MSYLRLKAMTSSKNPLLIDDRSAAPVLRVPGDRHVVWVHADAGLHAPHDAAHRIRPERPSYVTLVMILREY